MPYLGQQYAVSKIREVGRDVGTWSGSIVDTTEGSIRLWIDQDKWEKTKVWVNKLCMCKEY